MSFNPKNRISDSQYQKQIAAEKKHRVTVANEIVNTEEYQELLKMGLKPRVIVVEGHEVDSSSSS